MPVRRQTRTPVLPASDQDPYLETLAGELEIDRAHLEDEVAAQPALLWRVGAEVVRRTVVRDARRREWAEARARVDGMIRRSARERGTDVTDAAVAVQVGDHADVVRAVRALDAAREALRGARHLYDAFSARGRALDTLARLRER